jgi:hypothetical protein
MGTFFFLLNVIFSGRVRLIMLLKGVASSGFNQPNKLMQNQPNSERAKTKTGVV